MSAKYPHEALEFIQTKVAGFKAKIGLVLGSGLGKLVAALQDTTTIAYADLLGFSACTVDGHAGTLHLGYLHGVAVACLQGRAHLYEGLDRYAILNPIRTLKLLGCEVLISTNASGSLHPEITPGQIVLISDHINFQGYNPLVGKNDPEFGPRFFGMEDTYDATLREHMQRIAQRLNIPLDEGVYISVLGPNFETPAEIGALRILGADVVGMSTVPEVLAARHCGLRVVLLAAISNLAAGLSHEPLSHSVTLKGAERASARLLHLIDAFVADYAGV